MSFAEKTALGDYGLKAIADALARDMKAELKAMVMPAVEGRVDEMIDKIVAEYEINVAAYESHHHMGKEVIFRVSRPGKQT